MLTSLPLGTFRPLPLSWAPFREVPSKYMVCVGLLETWEFLTGESCEPVAELLWLAALSSSGSA